MHQTWNFVLVEEWENEAKMWETKGTHFRTLERKETRWRGGLCGASKPPREDL